MMRRHALVKSSLEFRRYESGHHQPPIATTGLLLAFPVRSSRDNPPAPVYATPPGPYRYSTPVSSATCTPVYPLARAASVTMYDQLLPPSCERYPRMFVPSVAMSASRLRLVALLLHAFGSAGPNVAAGVTAVFVVPFDSV